jgi:hypothetical protein
MRNRPTLSVDIVGIKPYILVAASTRVVDVNAPSVGTSRYVVRVGNNQDKAP